MSIVVKPAEGTERAAVELIAKELALPYVLPKLDRMKVSAVILRDGVISSAVFLRQTAETYLLVNPALKLRKRETLGDLMILHKELAGSAKRAGFTDLHCWIPPELEAKNFGKLLLHLGWVKPLWPCYSKEVI